MSLPKDGFELPGDAVSICRLLLALDGDEPKSVKLYRFVEVHRFALCAALKGVSESCVPIFADPTLARAAGVEELVTVLIEGSKDVGHSG
jgi:hypothetical protein